MEISHSKIGINDVFLDLQINADLISFPLFIPSLPLPKASIFFLSHTVSHAQSYWRTAIISCVRCLGLASRNIFEYLLLRACNILHVSAQCCVVYTYWHMAITSSVRCLETVSRNILEHVLLRACNILHTALQYTVAVQSFIEFIFTNMFKKTVRHYLDNTKYTEWSIISILNYIKSKHEISTHATEDLKADIYAALREYKQKKNVHTYAANRAEKLLSKSGQLSNEVGDFIIQLKKEREEQKYQITVERTVTSACTLKALKQCYDTHAEIDKLEETGSSSKRKVESEESESSESSDTESVMSERNDDDGSEYGEDIATKSFVTKTIFTKTYAEMDNTHKWTLLSGTVVEDVIFIKYKDVNTESLAHSWIIDLDDDEMASLFSRTDWQEISNRTLALPQLETLMVKSMSRFAGVTTTTELRNVLEKTTYRPKDELYNREMHYDAEWVDLVIRKMCVFIFTHYFPLPLLENPDHLLRKPHLEGWYDSNIWSFIVDHALQDLRCMVTERKESSSLATAIRKNRKRIRKEDRSRIGRRLDAIVKTDDDAYYEYGAVEVARTFRSIKSTKWLTDNLKLAKVLHDMLVRLELLVNNQESVVKKLQVVGLSRYRYSNEIFDITLEYRIEMPGSSNEPSGWPCVPHQTRSAVRSSNHRGTSAGSFQAVEQRLANESESFSNIFLNSNRYGFKMIRDCVAVVNSRHTFRTEAELFTELMQSGSTSPPRAAKTPWSFDTPTKKGI
ncbi:hypothetical protein BC936DRAFT_148828 [Jimgerdemannia flammicorona]|uniref:Uncharacterized protein n=1 Tax=Jimgerdemannia flammicorona TaxID=994334 RepID=A0A433D278_9FUNG|nr:hypothetical protein BC936DRAFT_148828 [Jimgerdemannia flammicorona]